VTALPSHRRARWASCRAGAALALGAILLLCAACAPPRPVNLLLVSVDTLRAGLLGSYGYERPTSPAFDALAARGVVFERAMAASPWTLPSHASLLTGRYPSRHGVRRAGAALPADVPSWAAALREQGFTTAAVVNSHLLGRDSGLERGFDDFVLVDEDVELREPSRVAEFAEGWLSLPRREPFFLFLHFYDVHSNYWSRPEYEAKFTRPYGGRLDGSTRQLMAVREGRLTLRPADVRHLVDLYAAGIRQLDDVLARLVAVLEREGLLEHTLVVLTSDHGEEFLEHGDVMHGRTHFEEVLHVPLVFVGPGVPAGVRVPEPVSLVDVLPTALGLLGRPAPAGLDGRDLRPLWERPGASLGERWLFAEADWRNEEDDVLRAVRSGHWKLVVNRRSGERRLYDLARDPRERVDVAAEHPDVVRRLEAALAEFAAGAREDAPAAPLTPEEIEKLRALGYL
jgi:arylsulfatase A-like enzyme